jgi:hypothetical protein
MTIFDNVFLAQESMEWVEESDKRLVLLLLDFQKNLSISIGTFFSLFFGLWDFASNGFNGFQFYTKLRCLPSKSIGRWEICLTYLSQFGRGVHNFTILVYINYKWTWVFVMQSNLWCAWSSTTKR